MLRKILYPFSLLYALVVRLRNLAYDRGWFSSKTYDTPTICVGNLSVGGTGKTPMIEFLIRMFSSGFKSQKIAVLSRGYKRSSKGYQLAENTSSVLEIGDEPYQIYQKFPEVAVAVDADRRNGISTLERTIAPDLILLDDAFQHRKVKATLYILLTAYGKLYVDDLYLPAGNLRDHKVAAKRANIIVVTKCPLDLSKNEKQRIVERLRPRAYQRLVFSYLEYSKAIYGENGPQELAVLGTDITLVTGIADPAPLVAYLKGLGLNVTHLKFPDHHSFSAADLERINTKSQVLTTEKDYVRLKGNVSELYYLPIAHRFFKPDDEVFEKWVMETVA